jgi:hypothetical protein
MSLPTGCPDLPEGYVLPAPAGCLLYVGAFCQHQSSTLTGQTGSVAPYRHHVSHHPIDQKKHDRHQRPLTRQRPQ